MLKKYQKGSDAVPLQGELSPEDKKRLHDISQISLWLDDYKDIFSDFDPRPYFERTLSDDFLLESKKAIRDKASGEIRMTLLIPEDRRNLRDEELIKKRLRGYFRTRFDFIKKQKTGVMKQGFLFVTVGIILMFVATFLLFTYMGKNFLVNFLVVVLEPGGWFLFWEGLHLIIFESKKLVPDLEFNRKMSSCEVLFFSY